MVGRQAKGLEVQGSNRGSDSSFFSLKSETVILQGTIYKFVSICEVVYILYVILRKSRLWRNMCICNEQ